MWTRPWSARTRRRNRPRRRSSAASASTRCGRSSTTARTAPENRWRSSSARVTPGRTLSPTTRRSSAPHWPSCPAIAGGARNVLVRVDGAGGTHELLDWLTRRRLAYSVGFTLPGDLAAIQAKLAEVPPEAWTPAYDADGQVRPGAWVAELTGLFDLSGWSAGMRLIVRKERPHPGAQLRITDVDGHRVTAFVTNTPAEGKGSQLADRELRHRRRARAEDRIRVAKDTGLANLPLKDMDQNA